MRKDISLISLQQIIHECDKHIYYLDYALDHLRKHLPFETSHLKNADPKIIGHLDQMIFRFSKLQDAMGQKLFRTGLYLLGEDAESETMIDVLNKIERLGIITDSNEWLLIRELRNEFSHEYPDEDETKTEAINALCDQVDYIKRTYIRFIDFLKEKAILNLENL